MTESLVHRGPDDFGYADANPAGGPCRFWKEDLPSDRLLSGVAMGHRRLSILDLTSAGHQPMANEDRSIVLAYNGEIYNYVELREELKARGARFSSRTDTEVLLRAYEEWGTECFTRFNGMWAVTLWDGRARKLVVSRDRFGVKPLYYAHIGKTWMFASEIKAILRYPGFPLSVNERRVFEFLSCGWVDHSAETLYSDVQTVEPGATMEITASNHKMRKYWTLSSDGGSEAKSEREWVDGYRELLADSIRLRVRSDVPIATMLSGGLDSTSIAGLIHAHRGAIHSGGEQVEYDGLRTYHHAFSACWPGWEGDEETNINLVCDRFGLSSQKLYIEGKTALDLLPTVVYHLDGPFLSPICIVHYLIMRAVREAGVKVVLNGHGSDETLAGYADIYLPYYLGDLLLTGRLLHFLRQRRAFRGVDNPTMGAILRTVGTSSMPGFLREGLTGMVHAIRGREPSLFSTSMGKVYPYRQTEETDATPSHSSLLKNVLRKSFLSEFIPQWLRAEDRMSMAHSVESRLPFMDYRLVEYAFRLPEDLRFKDGYTKFVLREAMKDILPEKIAWQRQKYKFAAPYTTWFRTSWRPLLEDLLLKQPSEIEPYLDGPLFRKKLRAWLDGDDQAMYSSIIWRCLNTVLWMRNVSNPRKGVRAEIGH